MALDDIVMIPATTNISLSGQPNKTGNKILDYETNLKIERAKYLLVSSTISLKDVAFEVGYYNFTSFIRRFKQLVGLTPGEYRKSNQKRQL